MSTKSCYKLDCLDLKILSLIDQNARENISTIAKKLKTSQQVISYRLQNLEAMEIIKGYISCIDYSTLGNTIYKIYLKLNATNENKQKIIDYLRSKKQTIKIIEVYSSNWDLIVKYSTEKLSESYEYINNLKINFKEEIVNMDYFILLEKTSFSRDYFTEKYRRLNNKIEYRFYDTKIEKLSTIDKKILYNIKNNARISSVYLAKEIDSTPNTVLSRLKQLKLCGIIKSYRPVFNFKKLPFSSYKILLKINPKKDHKEEELIKYFENNTNIINIRKFIGPWDLEIDIETTSKEEVFGFINCLRSDFFEIVKDVNLLDVSCEYYC